MQTPPETNGETMNDVTEKRAVKALEACAWALKRLALAAELQPDETRLVRAAKGCMRCGSLLTEPTRGELPKRTCAVCGLPEGSDGTIGGQEAGP